MKESEGTVEGVAGPVIAKAGLSRSRLVRVALLGVPADMVGYLVGHVREFLGKVERSSMSFEFVSSVYPSTAEYLPLPIDNASELLIAHEQALAHMADVAVVVDNGVWNESRMNHLDRLGRDVGCMIYWFDAGGTVGPSKGDDGAVVRPGVIPVYGDVRVLAAYLVYLVSGAEISID